MAEFDTPEQLAAAAERVKNDGYQHYDAYMPFPVEAVEDQMPKRGPYLGWLILIAGLCGMFSGLGLQAYIAVYYFPMNIGGRPNFSWPQFIPITFELSVLFAAFTAVFGMILLNGLPRPYHPVFNVDRFERASNDRFFICVESEDPKFDMVTTRDLLASMNPLSLSEVPY
ncbi:MAG TPA: DUF3341 domain-containing protein [Candidatus Kapabacteria bacterium]|nr:DUF3341 domain-containing protein [Candidatus Kapabacteria bacterium]